jgi:bacteriorhodopsin
MSSINSTGKASFVVQVITGAIDIYVLTKPIYGPMRFVKQLLWIETTVQLIEASFYIWLISKVKRERISEVRYYDWVITTPSMLFTYMMYLTHLHKKTINHNLYATAMDRLPDILPIVALNTLMLFFGYLAEIGKLSTLVGVTLGFFPFFTMFAWIYFKFANESALGRGTFWYFATVWGLYGVAALLPYVYKNISYNVLDVLAKNFFGLFLAYTLIQSIK